MNKFKAAVQSVVAEQVVSVKLPEISPRSRLSEVVTEARKRTSLTESSEEKRAVLMRGRLRLVDVSHRSDVSVADIHKDEAIAAVQEEAMTALCTIVAKGDGIKTLVKTGGVESIVLAMRLHVAKGELQQRGAAALEKVAAFGPVQRAAVVRSEALAALVDAIRAHADTPAVIERCTNTLATISAGDLTCKRACVATHVPQVVIAGMLRHLRRTNLQIRGLAVLASLTAGDSDCKQAVLAHGGVGAVCVAMQEHGRDVEAQSYGCSALGHLARGDMVCVHAVVRSAAIRRLVTAMRWYPTHSQLVLTAVGALATLSSNDDAEVARELMEEKVIGAIVGAADKNKRRAAISHAALTAFGNMILIVGSEAIAASLHYHVFQLVAELMDALPRSPALLIQACHCYLNAAAASLDAKEEIITHSYVKGAHHILTAMVNHETNAALAAAGCAALANLAAGEDTEHDEEYHLQENSLTAAVDTDTDSPRTEARRPTDGRRNTLLRPMPHRITHLASREGKGDERPPFGGSPSRSRPGTRQGDLSIDQVARAAAAKVHILRLGLVDAGVAPSIRRILAEHYRKSADVCEEALAVIRNLAAGDSSECREAIMEAGLLSHLVGAMRQHVGHAGLCEQGCYAIRNLACADTSHLVALLEAGSAGAIITALHHHKEGPSLARAGLAALRNLCVDTWGDGNALTTASGAADTIIAADGAAAIVVVMRANAEHALVQAHGCGALRNLACGTMGQIKSREMALNAISRVDGLGAALIAMARHPEVRAVQVQACGCLRNLATAPHLRAEMVQAGAVESVLLTLASRVGQREGCEQASACLANLLHVPRTGTTQTTEAHTSAAAQALIAVPTLVALVSDSTQRSGRLTAHICASLAALMDSSNGASAAVAHAAVVAGFGGEGLRRLIALLGEGGGAREAVNETSATQQIALCLCRIVERADEPTRTEIAASDERNEALYALQTLRDRWMLSLAEPGCRGLLDLLGMGAPSPAPAVAAGPASARTRSREL